MKPTTRTPVTSYNQGLLGDQEYIFAVKGRPFAILSSPNTTTPDFNLIDWALVRDLNLKMSDLQCTKFYFSGHKMRILGKISTTVQCIQDGRIFGNFHIKARVVEDLHTKLDTHGVAGNKLNEQLRAHMSVTDTDEADELPHTPRPKSKKVKKARKSSSVNSTPSHTSTASLPDEDDWSTTTASPYTQNINQLEEMFGENTDLEQNCIAQQVMLAEHDPNGQTDYGQEYQDEGGLLFNFTTTYGAIFVPGHGREGCSRYACARALHKPHNCGYHDAWLLPDNFQGCGLWCKGGLCSCLRGGGGGI